MSNIQLEMTRITILKEAIKAGLAFAAVFGIAMQLGWMNPYWAGWAVAVIALPTAGEAMRKGTLRVVGTIPDALPPSSSRRWRRRSAGCSCSSRAPGRSSRAT